MRIVIDMQGAQTGSRLRGIGRYSMALAQAMVRNRGEHEVILMLNGMFPETIAPIQQAFGKLLPRENIRTWHALPPVCTDIPDNDHRRHVAEAIREDFVQKLKPDVLHITSLFEGFGDNAVHSIKKHGNSPLIAVTFYDLIPLIQKEIYLDPNPHFKKPYYEKIEHLKESDLLLAISESSRREAIDHLGFAENQVVNISAAADEVFRPYFPEAQETIELKQRLGIRNQFIMYSGATDDRKNHRGLIQAYGLLPKSIRDTYQLVLVGGLPLEHRRQFEGYVHQYGLTASDVIITGRVSDKDLIHLYSICDLYVFPSWHEGFGLPALEAMSCGAPVIGSNNTSIPEVIGNERALFDPHSARSIADKILEILSSPELHADLKAHAVTQAARFSWDASARRTLCALEALHEASNKKQQDALPSKNGTSELIPHIAQIFAKCGGRNSINLAHLSQVLARNVQPSKPQLLVDVSELMLRDSHTGIQRVVRSILREWLLHPPPDFDVRLVYANNSVLGYRYANAFTKSFLATSNGLATTIAAEQDLPIDYALGDRFVALDMQHEVQIFQSPFYQIMRNAGVKTQFIVYDLLPINTPQYFPHEASINHLSWVKTAAQADSVICISKAVAADFEDWLEKNNTHSPHRSDIQWFHMGADIQSSMPTTGLPEDAAKVLAQISAAPAFLLVGTVEPRKGHEQVLETFEQLWRDGSAVSLVIIGKQGWAVEPLVSRIRNHSELNKHLFWFENASDEYLENIYDASTCLIAASYGEGFGLPLIEAAQHKLPIIARDIPVFREVAGEHAHYFSATEPDGLLQAIRHWLPLHAAGRQPRSEHMPWLTWHQSASHLMHIVLGARPSDLAESVFLPPTLPKVSHPTMCQESV